MHVNKEILILKSNKTIPILNEIKFSLILTLGIL